MKTRLTLVGFIIVLLACKPTAQPMSSANSLPNPNEKTYTKGGTNQEQVVYDMIITFISKGEGIDHKLQEKIDETIAAFNKKHKTTLTPEKLGWGREGETDYNFILKNLSTDLKKEFIKSIEALTSTTDMANITFNQPSVHKR